MIRSPRVQLSVIPNTHAHAHAHAYAAPCPLQIGELCSSAPSACRACIVLHVVVYRKSIRSISTKHSLSPPHHGSHLPAKLPARPLDYWAPSNTDPSA